MPYNSKPLKINFCDVYSKNQKFYEEWFPYRVWSKHFRLEVSENPDVLFFFPYGRDHFNYNCHKVQVIGENQRPAFWCADYALSFDYNDNPRHLRLPNYVDSFTPDYSLDRLLKPKSDEDAYRILQNKKKFCCFVVSNPNGKERNEFFARLSTYKQVDSGGWHMNNIGRNITNMLEFASDYKFIISFENTSYPGYTTEKVVKGKLADAVPVYWGNPLVYKEMNPKSFINFHDYGSFDKVMERVIELDQNDALYLEHLKQPLFYNHEPNEYFNEERLVLFFENVVRSLNKPPVSVTNLRYKLYKTQLQASRSVHRMAKSVYRKIVPLGS